MADSGITKRALAHSLKKLLGEHSFEKISVTDICDGCDMNRKSFYYHFRDKYDLVNWIFDTEFIRTVDNELRRKPWEYLGALCDYLYENRGFYRKALKIEGQNSFAEYFKAAISTDMSFVVDFFEGVRQEEHEFYIRFYANLLMCSVACWLSDRECVPPEQYLARLRKCAEIAANIV